MAPLPLLPPSEGASPAGLGRGGAPSMRTMKAAGATPEEARMASATCPRPISHTPPLPPPLVCDAAAAAAAALLLASLQVLPTSLCVKAPAPLLLMLPVVRVPILAASASSSIQLTLPHPLLLVLLLLLLMLVMSKATTDVALGNKGRVANRDVDSCADGENDGVIFCSVS